MMLEMLLQESGQRRLQRLPLNLCRDRERELRW